jgi:hypothetical protein
LTSRCLSFGTRSGIKVNLISPVDESKLKAKSSASKGKKRAIQSFPCKRGIRNGCNCTSILVSTITTKLKPLFLVSSRWWK